MEILPFLVLVVLTNSNNKVIFRGQTTKTITNNGTLSFYQLEIEDVQSNIVTTTSDFTVNNLLTTYDNATKGALIASGNSTITMAYAGTGPSTNGQASLQFQNVKYTAAATPNKSYTVSGDFICEASYNASAGGVLFDGSSEQEIKGGTAPYFFDIEIDGAGVKLNNTNVFIDGTTTALQLTEGDFDLNGDNIITFTAATAVLTEGNGYTVKNTGVGSGYITTITSGTSEPNIEASGFGITFDAGGPGTVVVRRYHNSLNINSTSSLERYFYITFTSGAVTGVTFDYDNTELNGNTAANLSLYKASASTATSWTGLGGTANGGTYTGNIAKTSGISGFTTGSYLAATSQAVTIAEHTTEGVHENNLMAASPLIASAQNKNILGFSLTSTGTTDFTGIDMTLNIDPSGKLSNFELYVDDDNDLSSYGMTKIGNVTQNGTSLQFTGFTQTLSAATAKYYFLVADVSTAVSSSTPQIFASFTQDDLTLSAGTANSNNFQGTAYSFDQLLVTVTIDNTPAAGYLTQDVIQQGLFGFTLTPSLNSPSVEFTSITLDADLDGGAPTTDFTLFKLYRDVNKNGTKDDNDVLISSVASMPVNQQIAFTGLTESFTEEIQYIVVAKVISSATDNGTIQLQISDENNITLTSPALVEDDSPWEGNVMTIAPVAAATNLVITSVMPDESIEGNENLSNNTLVDGLRFTVTVEAQDANGYPQKISTTNNINLSVTAGASDITVLGGAIDIDTKSSVTFKNVVLGNSGSGESGVIITTTNSASTLVNGSSSSIDLLANKPEISLSNLAISSVQPTQVTVTWNNPGDNCILVVKAGSAPTSPSNGTEYYQATANNFSTPNAVNGTTGTGSVVVYKGTGSTVNVTGLTAGTTYYFAIYNYNGTGDVTNYRTEAKPDNSIILVSETTLDTEPTVPASSIAFSGVTSTSMRLTWTRGNGDKNIVVAKEGGAVSANPTDGTAYGSSAAYGAATAAMSDGFVVYDGTSNTVEVTNLIPNTTYYFTIYEYAGSGDDINYLSTGAVSSNRSTLVTEPTAQAHDITYSDMTIGSNTSIKVNWVNGNGSKRMVVAKAGSAITSSETPVDGTVYETSDVEATSQTFGTTTQIGDGYIVFYGDAQNYVTINGLTYGQTYYFKVFEFNGTGTTSDDATFNFKTDESTDNPSSREADSYEDNNTLANAVQITADGTLYQGIISSATDEDWLYFTPDIANNLNNVRIKLTSLPKDYTIEVYTSAGRLVRSSKRTGTTDEIIVINNLPVGDYYIKIYSPSGDYSLTPYRVNAVSSTADYKSDTP